MFCKHCGKQIRDGARFCASCGAPVEDDRKGTDPINKAKDDLMASGMQMIQDTFGKAAVSDEEALEKLASEEPDWEEADYHDDPSLPKGMMRNARGDIHWNISLDMSKNPFILFTFYKLFLGSCFVFGLIIALAFGSDMGDPDEALAVFFAIFLGFGGGLSIIATIVYYLTMAVGGSMYTVDHLMTEDKVSYNLLGSESDEKQRKRADALLWIVDFLSNGLSSKGLSIETNGYIDSPYNEVRKITADKAHNMIRLKHRVIENRIYVEPEQFDFVFNYLTSHCQGARVIQ